MIIRVYKMKYDDRTRIVGSWLQQLLRRYTPPTGMDNETLKDEMVLIVEDVNKHIPSQFNDEMFKGVLIRIDGQIRAIHGARTWPTIKTFINATQEGVKAYDVKQITDGTEFSLDRFRLAEKRILAGEDVDELYIKDSLSRDQLLERGVVTMDDINKYVDPAA